MKILHRILTVTMACAMSFALFTGCGTVTDEDIERVIKQKGYITREEALSLINSNTSITYVTNSTSSTGSASVDSSTEKYISYNSSRLAAALEQLSGDQWRIEFTGGYAYDNTWEVAQNGSDRYVKLTWSSGDTVAALYKDGKVYAVEYSSDGKELADGVAVQLDDEYKNGYNSKYGLLNSIRSMLLNSGSGIECIGLPLTDDDIFSVKSGKITIKSIEYYAEIAYTTCGEMIFAFDGSAIKYIQADERVFTFTKYTNSVDSSMFTLPEIVIAEQEYDNADA